MNLSDRILNISPSQTIAMSAKARELAGEGKNVINLSIGEPDFNTPDFIKESAKKAIDDNFTHYSPVPGYPELRNAISDKFKTQNKLNYEPDQIVVSTGAKNSIANIMLCILNPGDEVLLPKPYWVSYKEIIKLAEATPIEIETKIENDFKFTAQELERHISDKTKAIIFSNPSNPTGSLMNREELKQIANLMSKHKNIYILSDEIYEHINYSGEYTSIAQFENVYDQTITINGLSKCVAMTGWRIGYIGAPKEIAKACNKIQGQITSGTCSISQIAAISALKAPLEKIKYIKDAFLKRRDFTLELLKTIPNIKYNIPLGAFYVFPDFSYYLNKEINGTKINNSFDLSMFILNKSYVATVPGETFGEPNCIRISYAQGKKK